MKKLLLALALALALAPGNAGAQTPVWLCTPGPTGCVPVGSTTNPLTVTDATGGAAGVTTVVSASAEASHVLKNAAGSLYGVYVSNPSATGFLLVFNATAVPGDGAVTPIHCIPVTASNIGFVNFLPGPPETYSTGISVAFSSTGCFTKTTSPTAFFHGYIK